MQIKLEDKEEDIEETNFKKPEDRVFKRGESRALSIASKKLKKIGWVPIRELQDPNGIFCIEYPKFFLTANGYLYRGSIVSNQKELIYRVNKKKKKLMVYVAETDKFFIFDPEDILNQHWENKRGYLTMYNWNISLGREFLS